MSAPRCVLIGTGRVAGGFVATLLRSAGWEVVLVGRDERIIRAINEGGGFLARAVGSPSGERWIDGVRALSFGDPALPKLAAGADLFATSVGPSALGSVGRKLAPLLGFRLAACRRPLNVITFENHRRAPELLAAGLFRARPQLARQIFRRFGVGGAALWRAISRRELTDGGLRFAANSMDECYADGLALVPGAPPHDGSIPGLELVRSFDDRIVAKLWVYNAGHAAAAYLGWRAGRETLDEAMEHSGVREAVAEVVAEAQEAFRAYLQSRPGSEPIPPRPPGAILDHYANPELEDAIVRVARELRRKLAAGDRLAGPAVAALDAGIQPTALARAMAAALAYRNETDPQSGALRREIELLGPGEVLAGLATLDPRDELVRLVCESYRTHSLDEVAA